VPSRLTKLLLHLIQAWDRYRLRRLQRLHPGLSIDPSASTNFASAEFHLAPGARLEIGPRAETDRRPGGLRFHVSAGAHVTIGEGVWLRTHIAPLLIAAFDSARLEMGPFCWMSGCHLSAKRRLTIGRETLIAPGCRVFDSDQHDLDDVRTEQTAPVDIGDWVWIAADATVLKGVRIGSHSIVGARSLVTDSIAEHTLAVGVPAKPVGRIGDRSKIPHI
jgi:maltose O-acetyltransferase